MSIESRAILGIKLLAQAERVVRGEEESTIPGVWYVDRLRTNTGRTDEARKIAGQHQIDTRDFRDLNERINTRALQRACQVDKRLEEVLK